MQCRFGMGMSEMRKKQERRQEKNNSIIESSSNKETNPTDRLLKHPKVINPKNVIGNYGHIKIPLFPPTSLCLLFSQLRSDWFLIQHLRFTSPGLDSRQ
ncbi:hypothetical protein VTN00DRAFT_1194 [Thermoascus crustaceus]|uniref:uncharacterized protein n=1 Tax=Thermoascus crustaceus TaxID=5088 RepID=UPI00374368A6